MSLDLLGEGFDLHGGGQDLAFPHHENERAQAVADGKRFAGHWMHNGFVEVGGEKMSKSLDNYVDLLDLAERADPRAYRLLVLRSHYRSPVEVTETTVADASAALERIDSFTRRVAALPQTSADPEVLDGFRSAMDDDLDTPRAVDLLFTSIRRANSALDAGDGAAGSALGAATAEICRAVGLELTSGAADVPAEVLDRARQRDEARSAKDFASADVLRDELVADGWVVEDTPSGTSVRRA
jgi:cysteinyl-tRNA synthetase